MKRGRYVLIIVLVFLVLIIAAAVSFFVWEFQRPVSVPSDAYLEIDLSGQILEVYQPDFISSLFLGFRPLALHDIWTNIRKAKTDGRVGALLLRLNAIDCDWAKASEIRDAVLDFRKSGKKAYAYIEDGTDFDKEYYVATACDEIVLHPLGMLGVNGIGGYVPFMKKGLAKLGIRAEFEHVEEYKTAYNQFTEDGFTPAHKEMMESLYGDIFDEYVRSVARARSKTEAEVRRLIDRGFFQGEQAQAAGLVDQVLYEDELLARIAKQTGSAHKIGLDDYARVSLTPPNVLPGRRIALIYAVGPILPGESLPQSIGSATLSRWIKTAREDDSIAAVVMRIDSPGGSAVASDVIWREVVLTRKVKPFVVSMSDVAGSGGYWIAMAAHKIVAQPQTLTGSIGVLSGKFDMSGLYEKLGITNEKLTFGKEADIFTSFRSLTEEERTLLKSQILWIYDRFLTKVAEGRQLTKEAVNAVGRGRVWTGRQARERKLVDELGGIQVALRLAKELAGLPTDREVGLTVWPKRRSFWSVLWGRGEAEAGLPVDDRRLKKSWALFRLLENERIWALMPSALSPE
jgi:protease-4